jgi:hypothetical protein
MTYSQMRTPDMARSSMQVGRPVAHQHNGQPELARLVVHNEDASAMSSVQYANGLDEQRQVAYADGRLAADGNSYVQQTGYGCPHCGGGMHGCAHCRGGHAGAVCGCGRPGCAHCRGWLAANHPYGGIPPHTPSSQLGGYGGTVPQYGYPYYTTRGPRDFFLNNPPTIGW